jgi:hypothetical protein
MNHPTKRSPRVSLTKKELSTNSGKLLLELLESIASDGKLSDDEINKLKDWVDASSVEDSPIGAFYLRELIGDVLADGTIDEGERAQIHRAVLRVMPKEARDSAEKKKNVAEIQERNEKSYTEPLATGPQIKYIRDLDGNCPPGTTISEASTIIQTLLTHRPTSRQQMVLRFWNRMDLAHSSVDQISDWMDKWYDEDPQRLEAWELWKKENGDTGGRSRELIEKVSIGMGNQYLQRVKMSQASKGVRKSGCLSLALSVVAIILVLLVCIVGIFL